MFSCHRLQYGSRIGKTGFGLSSNDDRREDHFDAGISDCYAASKEQGVSGPVQFPVLGFNGELEQTTTMVFKSQDAWRSHALFQNLWKRPFPGLRQAVVIYAVYMGADLTYKTITAPAKTSH